MSESFSARNLAMPRSPEKTDFADSASDEELVSDRLLTGAAPTSGPNFKKALKLGAACLGVCVGSALLLQGGAARPGRAARPQSGRTSQVVEFLATGPYYAETYGGGGAYAAAPVAAAPVCSTEADDCSQTGCCQTAGFQCYEKSAEIGKAYAGCKGFCIPGNGSNPEKDWACREIGMRTPMPMPMVNQCSWAGENCAAGTHCCNDANMKCFTKDDFFAGCHFNPQVGWVNQEIGKFRGWGQFIGPVAAGLQAGVNLYCITVQSPPMKAQPNRPATDDETLINAMRAKSIGIFACDASDVFMGRPAPKAEWQSISNTDIFIEMWEQVFLKGEFWHHDWTVKVDPDAVFFPDRLRSHLTKLMPPRDTPIYIKNTDFKFGFMGSLEIFSEKAMEEFHTNGHLCKDHIGHTGGEDFYMMTCMDGLGVGSMQDIEVLNDKYVISEKTGEKLDLKQISHCANGWTAAFHPYKDTDTWFGCHQLALDTASQWAATHPAGV